MLMKTLRYIRGKIFRHREFRGSSKQESIDQELQNSAVMRHRCLGIMFRIPASPGIDSSGPVNRRLELDTINSGARPTPMKIEPRFLKKDKPLVFHLLGHQAAFDALEFRA